MSGNNFLIDTNIALHLLSGNEKIAEILNGSQVYVSFITEVELLGYKNIKPDDLKKIKTFLTECIIIDVNDAIKNQVVRLRQQHSIKLPDAFIAATSLFLDMTLITADLGFRKLNSLELIVYTA